MDKTGESCPILSPPDLKLSCLLLLDTVGHSHWSGLAARAVIGRFGRWQGPDEAGVQSGVKGQILRHPLMTIHQHNVLLLDDAF